MKESELSPEGLYGDVLLLVSGKKKGENKPKERLTKFEVRS